MAQIVGGGCKVVFDTYESYIEDPHRKERIVLEPKGGFYMLKMWVPRNQPAAGNQPFPRRDYTGP